MTIKILYDDYRTEHFGGVTFFRCSESGELTILTDNGIETVIRNWLTISMVK